MRFNPRPHTAGDVERRDNKHHDEVSIHARTRRATLFVLDRHGERIVSIHARTRRATGLTGAHPSYIAFQSTPAHGGRPSLTRSTRPAECFNPRPHTAGDLDLTHVGGQWLVSIHARTRRATRQGNHSGQAQQVSIHARTRRATEV